MLDPRLIVLAVLFASIALFAADALRYDLIAVLVAWVLAITGCLEPEEAFQGFASEAVVVIACMYVFGRATSRWGIAELVAARLVVGRRGGESRAVLRVTGVSGLMSSVLSNTGVVATLIPVLGTVARETGVALSRLLMPLCYGALVGGMVTVIGTSTNVAINGALRELALPPFGLFEFAHLGLLLLALTALYFLGPGRLLLPRGRAPVSLSEQYQVPKFVTEVLVEPTSALINRLVADAELFERYRISVLGIVRGEGGDTVLAPGPYNRIRSDDVLILQGEPDAIVRLRRELGLRERESVALGSRRLESPDVQLVETVIPATSPLVGRTLREASFREETGVNVLAIAQHGDVRAGKLSDRVLAVGDTLLVQGHRRDVDRLRRTRDVLVLGEVEVQELGRGAVVTLLVLLGVLLIASVGAVPLSLAALTGVIALVFARCLRPYEVRDAVDWSVLLLIGGMLALGRAFERHGLGAALAGWITSFGSAEPSPRLLLALLLGVTTLLTQVMNHVTAAVLMTPVAASLAREIGVSDRPLLLAVLVGANLAFMSPVAHQANAMVMGPGAYRFRDFLRVGAPLTLLLAAASVIVIPLWWPFS